MLLLHNKSSHPTRNVRPNRRDVSLFSPRLGGRILSEGGSKLDQRRIGAFLRELRRGRGLTQQQIAEEFGVTVRTVSRWETGSNLPDIDLLLLLADYYEVDLKELLSGSRKDETMDDEMKETVRKVSDYKDIAQKRLTRTMRIMFVVGLIAFTAWLVMYFLGVQDTFTDGFIPGAMLGMSYGMMIVGVLYSTGVLAKISRAKAKLFGWDR